MTTLKKIIMRPIRRFQAQAVLEIAAVMQDGIDQGRTPEHLVPGIAFSIALMKNTIEKVMRNP